MACFFVCLSVTWLTKIHRAYYVSRASSLTATARGDKYSVRQWIKEEIAYNCSGHLILQWNLNLFYEMQIS